MEEDAGAVVRNILADGARADSLEGLAEQAEQLPEPARRLIVHFAQLGGEK